MKRILKGMRSDYLIQQRKVAQKKLADATTYNQKIELMKNI